MTRPYRILIADDEKPVAVGLQNQLESLGYDVVAVVSDGHRAIEMCRRSIPDVVFMDIEMPGLDGLSAARQIAADPGTPVIILTAHGHPNLIDQAVEDGVISYLLKPTLRERKLIERAKGILMTRKQLSESEAFRLLQRQSQDRRIPMAKLAESIIQTDELFEAQDQPPPTSASRPLRRHFELPQGE
jgi:AmiR/NasT family two-component response regulator